MKLFQSSLRPSQRTFPIVADSKGSKDGINSTMEEIEMLPSTPSAQQNGMRPIYRFEIPHQTDKKKKNKKHDKNFGKFPLF